MHYLEQYPSLGNWFCNEQNKTADKFRFKVMLGNFVCFFWSTDTLELFYNFLEFGGKKRYFKLNSQFFGGGL